jgi:hypothetical protein
MIGRNAAVAEVGPHHHELTGPFTFAAWLGIDALLLTTNRAKIDAFLEWAWDYKNYCGRHGSHSRLVCGSRIFSPAENSHMSIMAFVICSTKVASFTMWIRRLSSRAVRVPPDRQVKHRKRKRQMSVAPMAIPQRTMPARKYQVSGSMIASRRANPIRRQSDCSRVSP